MDVTTLILGAGAAGLFAASRTGPGTLVVDHAKAPGEKIRISGGGRCNFTNLHTTADCFLSGNPHFAKSALSRYSPADFVALVERHGIAWHEKTLGQLFCDRSARDVVAMLLAEAAGAELWLEAAVGEIGHQDGRFRVSVRRGGRDIVVTARHLVVATGGKSIPAMGATGLAYDIARRFEVPVTPVRPALVPFTFSDHPLPGLSGVALPVRAEAGGARFDEAMLITHRGLSGPAMLQVSSYWREGAPVTIDLLPGIDPAELLLAAKRREGRRGVAAVLARHLPQRLAERLAEPWPGRIADMPDAALLAVAASLSAWRVTPTGTEGWRTAEVTLGGIETGALSSRTMEARAVPGLFFIGECVDVTGWLGGYNFQWAWASAHAAGSEIATRR